MTNRRQLVSGVLTAAILLSTAPALAQQANADPGFPATGPISGYMDFHYNKANGEDGILDFHRFVLILSHSFSPRLRFVGELELEQAYVDFLLSRRLNLRAGMLLMPVGIINERHEPPVFNGVERPFVDTFIIPTTWFDVGAGAFGEIGRGLRYRVYAVAPLDSLEFNADEGIRGGRQKGSEDNVPNLAFTGRVEYLRVRRLTLGASIWNGSSNFATPTLKTPVAVDEFDARYTVDRLELRGEFAQVHIGDAAHHRREHRATRWGG